MKIFRMFSWMLIAIGATSSALSAEFEIGRRAASYFIVPSYALLQHQAQLQSAVLVPLCAEPSEQTLQSAQDQFANLVLAWSRIETVRFGPVLTDNRLERILFWPDRRGIGLRQVQTVLQTEDETALHQDTLRQKSVAVQGLAALEYVLFGTGYDQLSTTPDTFRCAYAQSIAQAIALTATEILSNWQNIDGVAAHMTEPQTEYADFRDEDEVVRELIGVWAHGMELLYDTRLRQLGDENKDGGNYRRALFWRSGLSIKAVAANMAGLHDLMVVSGIYGALDDEQSWIGGSLDLEFDNFRRTTGDMVDVPVSEVLSEAEWQGKVSYLLIVLPSIQEIVIKGLAAELGLGSGFSSMDGD